MSAKLANNARKRAQQVLVERFLSWELVETNLSQYPAISGIFPLDLLRSRSAKEPYFCHYLAWRLGTWRSEGLLRRLDQLLAIASSLPNWKHESSLTKTAEFADFWSLYWQMQVAEYLVNSGFEVEWRPQGPDLFAKHDDTSLFVECYQHRKSFHLELFIEELLDQMVDDLHLQHDFFFPLSLPHNAECTDFLDKALRPLLDDRFMELARREAQRRYPVIPAFRIKLSLSSSLKESHVREAQVPVNGVVDGAA